VRPGEPGSLVGLPLGGHAVAELKWRITQHLLLKDLGEGWSFEGTGFSPYIKQNAWALAPEGRPIPQEARFRCGISIVRGP
jgi:hypothetical protein